MKFIYVKFTMVIMSLWYTCRSEAQAPACDSTPANCNWNLIQPIYTGANAIGSKLNRPYKAASLPPESKDIIYTADETTANCIDPVPANPPGFQCVAAGGSLKYDVYYPKNHRYNPSNGGCPLPAVILFHAGGFQECTFKDADLMTELCEQFARRGFVAFSVEYRRGRVKDHRGQFTSVQQQLAAYRAAQDVRGAIRSIIKRQQNHNTEFPDDPYQIDIENIFVGGASAGAFAANLAAWYTDQMVYDVFPAISTSQIYDVLGPINADFYYGNATYNYRPKVKGILNCWGAVPVPPGQTDQQFFPSSVIKPVIAFHGNADQVFPIDNTPNNRQKVRFSPDIYNTENACLINSPYQLDINNSSIDAYNRSSLDMYNLAKGYGKLTELYIDCDMTHGIDNKTQTYFGTGLSSTPDVARYIVERAATFFQAILNNKAPADIGPPSKFTDCPNTRRKCTKLAAPACSDNGTCQ